MAVMHLGKKIYRSK